MPALNHLSASADPALVARRHAVGLTGRHGQRPRRISDVPLGLIVCAPVETARDRMRHRDPTIWGTAVQSHAHNGAMQ